MIWTGAARLRRPDNRLGGGRRRADRLPGVADQGFRRAGHADGAALLAGGLALLWWLGPRGRLVNVAGTETSLPERLAVPPLTGWRYSNIALVGDKRFLLSDDGAAFLT